MKVQVDQKRRVRTGNFQVERVLAAAPPVERDVEEEELRPGPFRTCREQTIQMLATYTILVSEIESRNAFIGLFQVL